MGEQPAWGVKISNYFILPQRVILSLMGFMAILNAYTMRISLSVAITQLVVAKNHTGSGHSEGVCMREPVKPGEEVVPHGGEYTWSEEHQGLILSSFYWGYIITHIPGGILAEKFGGKWTLCLGILSTAIFTLLTPLAIRMGGSYALIVVRVIMGMGEGTTFPALSVLIASWVPLKERSKLGALVLGGGQVGTILGNSISGLLLDAYVWDYTFYFFGGMAVIWFLVFTVLCYSDPGSHPFIKQSEKEYLIREMGSIDRKTDLPPTPWKKIITNAPMLALISAQIGHDWGFYIMVTDLPKYMNDVMQFSIKHNGIYSSLPYLMMWIVSLLSGVFADWFITNDIIGITKSRKMFTSIAAIGPAVFIVAASYAGCNRFLVVAFFTIAMGLMGTYYAGMKLNPIDLSPNYSGTLMAITNGIGSITGIITPYLVGVMTPNTTLLEWRLVFWVAFVVLVSTSIVYMIWASGEVQDFNDYRPEKDMEEGGQKKNTK
ncbi:putative inorganic phosphate cotransporter isoform X2 [Eupeodes corollae]|uniref:putative inorganic phosphate cotransporter isoform X1 n=1 Tax=Eupeodes corollae TaxID=290404 RepID=UPI00248F8E6C|nr:putative inorganic phosphate cotransporter isoform X1 [Eupeodes corollae]XP_055920217.1 putative inorganic phosphate cotransporter isoform X2 [Eupeodes corollae]